MKVIVFAAVFVAALLCVSTGVAHASTTTASTPETMPHHMHARIRHYVHVHKRKWIVRRKLMLCVLPPDVQVAWDWPGPACAYRDNFIFPPHRHRYYVN